MEIELRSARPSSEIRHAWKAAVENYPLRATRLDLSVLNDKEQEKTQSLLSDPINKYVGIGRDVHLTAANWAMVKREDGFAIWQAQIRSVAALSMQVRFNDFDLGLGMSVKVYGLSGASPVGEYMGRGLEDAGMFWSLAVPGDTVVVEYWLPAELKTHPGDFPFKVEKIIHYFKGAGGELSGVNVSRFVPRHTACGDPVPVCSANDRAGQGVGHLRMLDVSSLSAPRVVECSGVLLNNRRRDSALYFLTSFYCVDFSLLGRSPETPVGFRLQSSVLGLDPPMFRFRYDDCDTDNSLVTNAAGVNYIAGSDLGDWALLRIAGQLTGIPGIPLLGLPEYTATLLGWNADPREKFAGYTIHHGGYGSATTAGQQTRSSFDSTGFLYLDRRRSWDFLPCLGAGCAYLQLQLGQSIFYRGTGAPIFVNGSQDVVGVVAGVVRNDGFCEAHASRFSKIYEDGRVQGALNYGNDYYWERGEARSFDDSARPSYYIPPPEINEGGEKEFKVRYKDFSSDFSLTAVADDPSTLSWQLLPGSTPRAQGSTARVLRDRGANVRVAYEVQGGIKEEDRFSLRVSDMYGSDEITIFVIPDKPPVIRRVFGREVGDDDELVVYISPQIQEVTLRAIAFDDLASTLKWTTEDTRANGAISARFLLDDTGEIVNRVSGTEKVRVLYKRGSTAVTSGSFAITVEDSPLYQIDSLRVRMIEDATTPVIVNEGVTITETVKTLEVEIPYYSKQLNLDLLTSSARAGLVGEQISSTPTEAQALFLPADGEGTLKVDLQVPQSLDEASFEIRVSNGSASEEITIRVERELIIPVRSKVLLGGATR